MKQYENEAHLSDVASQPGMCRNHGIHLGKQQVGHVPQEEVFNYEESQDTYNFNDVLCSNMLLYYACIK